MRIQRKELQKKKQSGFTLIELMVTILIGLLLTLAVLIVQTRLSRTNLQLSDSAERNDQARTALNLLQYDLSNALYMVGGATAQCAATVQYTGITGSPTVSLSAVSALAQPAALPSTTALTDPLMDPSQYVTAPLGGGTADASDMVAITLVPTALRAPPSTVASTAPYKTVANVVATATSGQQAIANGVLPLNNNTDILAGDNVTLVLPMTSGPVTGLACLRFKVGSLTTVTTTAGGSIPAVQMPSPGNFSLFTAPLVAAGLLASASPGLTNAQLAGAKLRDEGPTSGLTSTQTLVYYAATVSNGAAGAVPVLARALINPDGTLAAQPVPVAAGVVSLQVRFGTDGAALTDAVTGGVTHYLTWAQVSNAKIEERVRTVLYAIVSRTLQSDPKNTPVTQVNVPSPQLASGDTAFTAFRPRTAGEQFDRYTVQTAEVALRNQIWGR